jgi:hypothetical protein
VPASKSKPNSHSFRHAKGALAFRVAFMFAGVKIQLSGFNLPAHRVASRAGVPAS